MINSKRIVCIVQARMSSTRLPGKVMMPILGEPMILYTLKRLDLCETIDEIVLATSELPEDGCLASYASRQGFSVFRGSKDDVLGRYVLTNRQYRGDIVIRVTGDCPLIAPGVVDMAVNSFFDAGTDYLSIEVIRGLNTEVFSAEALERAYTIVAGLDDFKNYKEHVTIYMYRHPEEFTIKTISADKKLRRPYRLCVDEVDDFRLVEEIYKHFRSPYADINDVVDFLDENPEIASINSGVMQKKA